MTRKILSLNIKRKTEAKQVEKKVKDTSHDDPQKRFLNGTAINPNQCINLELGSTELTVRAMDLFTPIGMGQRGLIVAPPGCGKNNHFKTYLSGGR